MGAIQGHCLIDQNVVPPTLVSTQSKGRRLWLKMLRPTMFWQCWTNKRGKRQNFRREAEDKPLAQFETENLARRQAMQDKRRQCLEEAECCKSSNKRSMIKPKEMWKQLTCCMMLRQQNLLTLQLLQSLLNLCQSQHKPSTPQVPHSFLNLHQL